MTRYRQEVEDETGWTQWIQPAMPEHGETTYRLACCDCGLVHELEFRVHDGRIQFRGRRNERATSAKRAHRRKAA